MSFLKTFKSLCLLSCLLGLVADTAKAQTPAIICSIFYNYLNQHILIYPNLYMTIAEDATQQGLTIRDPSGITYLRLPARNPTYEAFFIDWNGAIVQISPYGLHQIGTCQYTSGDFPQNPNTFNYSPPPLSNWGVRFNDTSIPIPKAFVSGRDRYVNLLYATPELASRCASGTPTDKGFSDCMLKSMLPREQKNIYTCARLSKDKSAAALCMLGKTSDPKLNAAANQLGVCYSRFGTNWERYPLCFADQSSSDDRVSRLLSCVEKQEGDVSFWGTAVCYGASNLHITPEQEVAIQCAATTGGEPIDFAGCVGGKLTARELQKCLTDGVGGGGCFGENNDIVKGLASVGIKLDNVLGPNNDLVRTWNQGVTDLTQGPGPSNDVVKVFANIGNDLTNGPSRSNDIVQAIDGIIPGFANLF